MAKVGVSLKIDVSKIDKARLFKGQKGVYLDATVFIDTDQLDQYGNSGMITQDVTKDEKQRGVKGNILGNCKVFWSDNQNSAPQQQQSPQQQGGYQQQAQLQQSIYQQAPQQQSQAGQQQPAQLDDGWDDDIPF